MTGWLASVTDVAEARLALVANASIIDCKNPRAGALGALPGATVRAVTAAVAGRVPVSATVGDFPDMDPDAVATAVAAMAEISVDFVKIGLFPSPALDDCLAALAPTAQRQSLVAVLFADRRPDFTLIPRLAALGFVGVMLDTAGKAEGGLLAHQSTDSLAGFVRQARQHGLLTGLAGSLKLADIDRLLPLEADYLGFRGALCRDHARVATLDPAQLAAISGRMESALAPV